MTKVVIQIPCYNEAGTLAVTLSALPRSLAGIEKIEVLVIDDGSTDATSEVAYANGANYVLGLPRNRGLAKAFVAGLDASLRAGADIIVNTDADNQYVADDIAKLVEPIRNGAAEIVVGERATREMDEFSATKKLLQRLGSWVVRRASNTSIPDATSGFRAFSRGAAQEINVFSDYSYTLETIIQAGHKGLAITSVPIRTNPPLRPSRLVRSIPSYVWRSAWTIFRIFITYQPFQFFAALGGSIFLVGFLIGLRFVYFVLVGEGGGHIQSLILASLSMSMGFVAFITGILADLISVNRKLSERIDLRLRRMEDRIGAATGTSDANRGHEMSYAAVVDEEQLKGESR